jgi:hypothetical protein
MMKKSPEAKKAKVNARMKEYMKEYQRTNKRYKESHKKSLQKYRKTVKGQASKLISGAKFRAKGSGLEVTIDRQWCIDRLEKGHCERTGMLFDRETTESKCAPSIDRIDRTKGYTPDNCQLVVWIYNTCKNKYADSDVLEFARCLVAYVSTNTATH